MCPDKQVGVKGNVTDGVKVKYTRVKVRGRMIVKGQMKAGRAESINKVGRKSCGLCSKGENVAVVIRKSQ